MVPEKKTIREEEALYAAAVNDHRGEKKIKRREQGVLRIYVRDSFPLFPSFLRPPQIPPEISLSALPSPHHAPLRIHAP
jgi:hypothetical protein